MESILAKLKADFEFYTGKVYEGLIEAIGAGFASRLNEFNGKLDFIKKQAFIETADSDYLTLHSGHILSLKPAEVASGYGVFYGENGAVINAGAVIKDDDMDFDVLSDGVISRHSIIRVVNVLDGIAGVDYEYGFTNCECIVDGEHKQLTVGDVMYFDAGDLLDGDNVEIIVYKSNLVKVSASEAGSSGNRALNRVLKNKTVIDGVNTEAVVVDISGGIDDESVEDYRKRVKEHLAKPQSPFNENNIRRVLLDGVKTLKYVNIKGGEYEANKVKVFAINKSNNLSDDENSEIVKKINDIRPVQMSESEISVVMPVVKSIDVVISNVLPAHENMQNEITKNIEYLFDVNLFEKGVSVSDIESVIYRTKYDDENVESFALVSGSCDAEEGVFWILNEVIFQ